ncbi:DUF397 domain-containing protein [Amycolatopsis sp. NPDC051373]|uniref:DUF397 domain-containing protein n=1 Tax=Amycolatopsis sp. NPDC051373 TaxID=3155801 RepID=UPI00344EB26D
MGTWFKSSWSPDHADCVEVRFAEDHVGVRDTKDRTGGQLGLRPQAWSGLLESVAADR